MQQKIMASKTIIKERSRDLKLIPMIWMFPDQNPSIEEHAWKNWRVSFLMMMPTCTSHAVLMYITCACPVWFPCKQPMCVMCISLVHDLCHPVHYSTTSNEVSYTQDLLPDDSTHDLGTPKCGLWKGGGHGSHYLWRWKTTLTKVIRKP